MINQDRIKKCYLDTLTRAVKDSVAVFTRSMNGQVNLSAPASQEGLARLIVSRLDELDLLGSLDTEV